MLKPLCPIVKDWYDHEFDPIQHQMQVHALYGNNHRGIEMAKGNEEKSPTNKTITSEPVSAHLTIEAVRISINTTASNPVYAVLQCYYPHWTAGKHFPPPKTC